MNRSSRLSSAEGTGRFKRELPKYDSRADAAKDEALEQDKVLRCSGSNDVPAGSIKVGLQLVDNLNGSQLVSIYPERYDTSPLVFKGELTAMGFMADLLRAMERLG